MPATTGNRLQLLIGALVVVLVVAAAAVVWLTGRDDSAGAADGDATPSTAATTSSGTTTSESTPPSATTPSTTSAPASSFAAQPTGELVSPPVPQQTPEGAVEFLTWWIALRDYAELSGQSDLIRQYSILPDCEYCQAQIDAIDALYGQGGRSERLRETEVRNLSPSPVDANGYVVVDYEWDDPARRSIAADGSVIAQSPGSSFSEVLAGVQWAEGVWRVRGIAY